MKDDAKKLLSSFIFDGILTIILGIVLIIWGDDVLRWAFIVAGSMIGVFGLIKTITFFVDKDRTHEARELVVGICEILVGIAIVVFSAAFKEFFVLAFNYFIAVIITFSAIVLIAHAITVRKESKAMMILSLIFAGVSVAIAVFLFINPTWLASFVTRLAGIALIVEGLAMIIFFRKMKKAKENATVTIVEETVTAEEPKEE